MPCLPQEVVVNDTLPWQLVSAGRLDPLSHRKQMELKLLSILLDVDVSAISLRVGSACFLTVSLLSEIRAANCQGSASFQVQVTPSQVMKFESTSCHGGGCHASINTDECIPQVTMNQYTTLKMMIIVANTNTKLNSKCKLAHNTILNVN